MPRRVWGRLPRSSTTSVGWPNWVWPISSWRCRPDRLPNRSSYKCSASPTRCGHSCLFRCSRWLTEGVDVDVIVVGSGGAGMSAALTAAVGGADVLVLERTDRLGGTTTYSGGALW